MGQADVKIEDKDVTLVAMAEMIQRAMEAAAELAKEGIEIEVIDLVLFYL